MDLLLTLSLGTACGIVGLLVGICLGRNFERTDMFLAGKRKL